MLTYRELLTKLQTLNEDQLAANVVIFASWDNEYIPVDKMMFAGEENDVLDEDHPILNLSNDEDDYPFVEVADHRENPER